MRSVLLALVVPPLLAAGCCRDDYAGRDEATVRRELELPTSARLVRLEGLPNDPHLMQRESLRIDATFQLDADARKAYAPAVARNFKPVPVPAAVSGFRDPPPSDMVHASSGHQYCQVRVYAPNSNTVASVHPCDKAPADFDAFLLATYDESTGKMRVWLKHYF